MESQKILGRQNKLKRTKLEFSHLLISNILQSYSNQNSVVLT